MIICFDLDGTLCTQEKDYSKASLYPDRVNEVNKSFNEGHTIIIFSARGSTTGIDWREITEKQLRKWGVKYHKLIFGKPEADFYIDDKGVEADVFFGR